MKRRGFTLTASLIIMITGLTFSFFTSCEGPAGAPGEDANESCNHCHNDEVLVLAAMVQHSNSGHQMGSTFERNGTSCAPCHTHQGYHEILATGEQSTSSEVSNPLPANCRTCHKIHENFDSTDFALRNPDPVQMWIDGTEIDLGSGNQCINCHQARVPDPLPTADAETVSITNSRWAHTMVFRLICSGAVDPMKLLVLNPLRIPEPTLTPVQAVTDAIWQSLLVHLQVDIHLV